MFMANVWHSMPEKNADPFSHRVPMYPSQNDIPYLFPTYSWLDDPYFLPILHEIVWNIFTYREYFKILDTRGYGFLTILVLSVVKYPFCFNELSYIFSTSLKT